MFHVSCENFFTMRRGKINSNHIRSRSWRDATPSLPDWSVGRIIENMENIYICLSGLLYVTVAGFLLHSSKTISGAAIHYAAMNSLRFSTQP